MGVGSCVVMEQKVIRDEVKKLRGKKIRWNSQRTGKIWGGMGHDKPGSQISNEWDFLEGT